MSYSRKTPGSQRRLRHNRRPKANSNLLKSTSKADVRAEINDQVEKFLAQGGNIEQVQQGKSAYRDGPPSTSSIIFNQPRQQRTPLPDVVEAIEQRKRKRYKKPQGTTRRVVKKPRIIYDDFGEPLRKIWD